MRNKIEQVWNGFTPEKKKKIVMLLLAGSIIIIGVIGYKLSRPSVPVQQAPAETRRELALETGILERSAYMESQRQLEELRGQIDELRKLKEQEAAAGAAVGDAGINQNEVPQMPQGVPPIPQGAPPFPQGVPPIPQGGNVAFPPPVQAGQLPVEQQPPPPPVILGGISVVSGNVVEEDKEDEDKKKDIETIYLPPSFMEATLLSGLNAPTIGDGQANPVPVLMRVKDIAVLPNRVRANLKGCFVIADGTGSLADERAHLRLVSLSCIARNGRSVIDQRIKGFVIDSDGKIGLSGRVVSKMGSTIAKSFLAGMFGGFGTAVQAAKTPTAISPLGAVQAPPANDLQNIAVAGVGGGIATAATEIQNFYLELARQSVPVIEVGAAKTVTLVISEGVELEIKDFRTLEGGSK